MLMTPIGARRYTLTARKGTYVLTDQHTGSRIRAHNPCPAMLATLDELVTGRAA